MMLIKFSTDLGSGAAPRSLLHFRSLDISIIWLAQRHDHTRHIHIMETKFWKTGCGCRVDLCLF